METELVHPMDYYQNLSESETYWLDLVLQCRASGKPDYQWLRENNISPTTFYCHIKQLKAKSCNIPKSCKHRATEANDVVPWAVDDNEGGMVQLQTSAAAVMVTVGGLRVEISNNATQQTVQNTLSVLLAIC
jgi:hypothetical protein